jgi:hypothetical protein
MIVQYMLLEFQDVFESSRSTQDRLLAAFYCDYFSDAYRYSGIDVTRYVDDLFDSNSRDYDDRYDNRYDDSD